VKKIDSGDTIYPYATSAPPQDDPLPAVQPKQ
jgi:hypothetical protein